MNLAAMRMR